MSKKELVLFHKRRIESISKLLKINKNKIKTYLHEDCHKYYSYYFFPERENGLAITAEGLGDYSNGSVSTIKNSIFNLKASNTQNHLGHIYQYITLLLGMKPMNHEYKVMGLAAYASNYEIEKCYDVFDKILKVKKLNIEFIGIDNSKNNKLKEIGAGIVFNDFEKYELIYKKLGINENTTANNG